MPKTTLRPPPTVADRGTRRQRVVRALGRTLATLGLAVTFVAGLGGGIALHIDLPASRRLASDLLSRSLVGVFHGELRTGEIQELSLRGATLDEVTVKDEAGNTVITLHDLRVRTDVLSLLHEVLTADERITLIVRHIRAGRADVLVIPDESGVPTLARALTPVPSAPSAEPKKPAAPSRPLRLWLPQIEIGRIDARGTVAGLPTLEVGLAGVRGSVLATPKGAAIDVHRYGMTVRGLGGTDATGTGEIHIRAPGAVWTSFNGYFGNLPVSSSVYVKGKTIKASLDVPKALPEDVRALLADWPVLEPVAAHVEATGELPKLETQARFEVGEARLTSAGHVRFAPELEIGLDVQGRGVDIRALWPKAPKTSATLDTALAIWQKRGQISVEVNGTTAETTFVGQMVPPIDVSGSWDPKGFVGKATVHEVGMPLKVGFTVHPNGAVDLDARARSFQMELAPRLKKLTPARGRADAQVKAHIEKNTLDATLSADVSGFSLADVKLARGHVTGHAKGKLTELEKLAIDAKVTGSDFSARGQSFGKVSGTAKGPVIRPALTATLTDPHGPEVRASGTLEAKGKPAVKNVQVQIKRDDAVLAGKIAHLDLDAQDVVVDSMKLTGAGGELGGKVRISKGRVELKAKGERLDLDVVSRALGLRRGMLGGTLNVDADIVASKEKSTGHVKLGLGKGSIAAVGGISMSLDASLEGEHIEGKASGIVRDIGAFGATWQSELNGNPAEPKSWAGMTGDGEIQLSDIQLSLLRLVLPKSARIEKVAGTAFARVRVERLAPKELPNARVEIAGTRGLEVVQGPAKKGERPLVVQGIDVTMVGGVNGEKGDASGTTQLVDAVGPVVTTSGTARVAWKEIVAAPDEWLGHLLEAPVMAVITLHERPFSQFPPVIRPEGVQGTGAARLLFSGSASDPKLSANVEARQIQSTASRRALPVDLRANGEYELASGRFGANAELLAAGRRIAQLTTKGNADIVGGTWTGGAHLALEGTPLTVVPGFADAKVAGALQGNVALQRTQADAPPQLSANVDLTGASVDGVSVGHGNVLVRSDGKQLRAQAELDDGRGRLTAEARLGLDWGGALPALDRARRVLLSAEAKGYDAVVLSPFLRDIFSRLTGKVDGRLTATLEPRLKSNGDPTGQFETDVDGRATVSQGVVHIAPLGIEFRDVTFGATAKKAGGFTRVNVFDVEGKARSEKVNLRALANFYFDGVRMTRGNASLSMTEVPVMFQGVSQAIASGSATLKLEREEERMVVTVDIPNLNARLPQAGGREVVDVADNPAIQVVQALKEPTVERTGSTLPWRFVVNLKRGVRITRSDLDLPLVGQPVIDLEKKAVVGGFIELEPGGRFQSWGKTWVIEAGRVVFDTPEPTDPHLFATASWRAPDATVVYVDVRGTLKDAKLKLSSDPARSEPEIMALLFGGSSSGASDEASGARTRETAAAGGIATAFNTLFADALVGSVELRTGTDENKASYTAAVRLSESVWFEGTYRNRLEQQQNTTTTEPVDVSGTVDWRFRRNWSLRTEVGTLGTGLDLLWQYRY